MSRHDPSPPRASADAPPIRFGEFVALVASLMSLTALGIDTMLPALPAIGQALDVADANARQFVITAFVTGFGVGQLIHGPLTDRFGRRPVLLVAIASYAALNAVAALSASFALLLAARVAGGLAVAACRVATTAMVRDCYAGAAMARLMSIAMMVFMIVPVIAPALGQAVLLVGDWRLIFWTIAAYAAAVLVWFWARVPETQAPENRHALHPARIWRDWRRTVGDRASLGYTLASGVILGGLYGYLNSIPQIMGDVFARPGLLALVFALSASAMAAANLTNARMVMRLGTRRIGHWALGVLVVNNAVHLAASLTGHETLVSFVLFQSVTLACFGLTSANFSAMAMANMGPIAGTASSVQGFLSVVGASAIGAMIGQAFDGSTVPLAAGFLLCSLAALAIVAVTERGRLFGN